MKAEISVPRVLLALGLTVAAAGVMVWAQLPPWEREHMAASARSRARWLAAALARRSGMAAITDEARQGPEATAWRRALTYRLSRMRDSI